MRFCMFCEWAAFMVTTAANIDDGVAATLLFKKITQEQCPRLRMIWGDNKYHNLNFRAFLARERPGWQLEVKKPPKGSQGFVPVPQRWGVERTFAWMGRNRRLSKDYERTIVSSEATVKLANVALLLRRLEPNKNTQNSIIVTFYKKPLFNGEEFPNGL